MRNDEDYDVYDPEDYSDYAYEYEEYEGYEDNDFIEEVFDGDPELYWNID